MTMNYKSGGMWFTVSVAPEFCIRMDVEGLSSCPGVRQETYLCECHRLILRIKTGLLSPYISI